jgi:hypothetical protein
MVSGMFQKRYGVRSRLPDVVVLYRRKPSGRCPLRAAFVDLKPSRGIASKAQKQIRAEILLAGAKWGMARSARAAMMGAASLRRGIPVPLEPPRLKPWVGPFAREVAA